jgi:alpha-tubulin suppressor-like RCC1 family protein
MSPRSRHAAVKERGLTILFVLAGGCSAGAETGVDPSPTPASLGTQVVVTLGHRCVTRAGRVWCWGRDEVGQTGLGAPTPSGTRDEPQEIPNLTDVVELAASDEHTCARLASGRVKCWGVNGLGEVGPVSAPAGTCSVLATDGGGGDAACQPVPTEVPGIEGAVQLALNDNRSCARLASGVTKCWGQSLRGADWLPTVADAREIALGNQAGCAVGAAGTIACSGPQPWTIQEWTDIDKVVMAQRTQLACALGIHGSVACWGANEAGQRGLGNTDPNIPFPGDPPAIGAGATAVSVGWSHVCALLNDGAVTCWGRNTSGAVGLPIVLSCSAGPCQLTPHTVAGLPSMAHLGAGGDTSCAVTTDHRLFCWGALAGEATNGTPVHVAGPWEQL